MDRKEFIKMCGILGIGTPVLKACNSFLKDTALLKPADKVIIIGAGAAGLTAAYLLNQKGIDVKILEANSRYGGRMKRTKDFADFPIPIGAEWLHTNRKILDEIVNNKAVKIETVTQPYNPDVDYALVDGKKEALKKLDFTIDQKFINATWFDFFDQYIVPSIKNKISLSKVVQSIDYTADKVRIETSNENYVADRVIITVPVKMLQNNSIQFTPALPAEKLEVIKNVTVWDGCKGFIEFSEKFYPAVIGFENMPGNAGYKLFYDAAYGQNTQQNILGLFAVGPISNPYIERSGTALINYILDELDQVFEGKASPNYIKYIFQDWTKEPFARGAYVPYFEDWKNIRALGKPVGDKLYFAGDAYTDGNDWSSVHAAAQSAKRAVEALVG